jgi:type IV pilus assembly protein PilO
MATSENLQRHPISVKFSIVLCILVVMVGMSWHFFLSQKVYVFINAIKELHRAEAEIDEYKAMAKELPRFELEFKKLNKEFKEAIGELLEKKEIPNFIDSIYTTILASSLKPDTFALKPEVKRGIYDEIPIEVNVYGTYYDLSRFFYTVSKLPRIINIRDLNLNQDMEMSSDDKVVLKASFTIFIFELTELSSQ